MQANDLRKGQVINFNGESCLVMEVMHRTPGNLRAFVQAKLRNLRTGRSGDQRFRVAIFARLTIRQLTVSNPC